MTRIFLETTLFNRYFDIDREGHEETVALFEAIGKGLFESYTSDNVIYELKKAKEPKQSKMISLISELNISILETDEEVIRLGNIYVQQQVIPKKYYLDGYHISIATVNVLDYILSYNFEHINKKKTKQMTELINKQEGYKGIIICTPKEIMK